VLLKCKHILSVIMVVLTLGLSAQAQEMMVVAPANVYAVTGYTMANNDEIEIYYDSLNIKLAKAVSLTYNTAKQTFKLPQNTASVGKNGFNEGDIIYLKIFSNQLNCRIEASALFSKKNTSGNFTFVSGQTDTLNLVNAQVLDFFYVPNAICTDSVIPTVGNVVDPYLPLPQYSYGSGLNMGSQGIVKHAGSEPGVYFITVFHPVCIANNGNISVTILPSLRFDRSNLVLGPSECAGSNGYIKIKPIPDAVYPLTYLFVKGDAQIAIGGSDSVGQLDQGIYDIQVTDKLSCKGNAEAELQCTNPSLPMNLTVLPDFANTSNIAIGDLLEVYYDSLSIKLKQAARIIWNGTSLTFTLPPNTATVGKNGFYQNDTIFLRIYSMSSNCRVKLKTQFKVLPFPVFKGGISDTVTTGQGGLVAFGYSPKILCNTVTEAVVGLQGRRPQGVPIPILSPSFSSTPAGLNLDTQTGKVAWVGSLPGSYVVKIQSDACLVTDELSITIERPLDITKSQLSIEEPACNEENGKLEVLLNKLPGLAPYSFTYGKNGFSIENQPVSNVLDSLSAGNYQVVVYDYNGCKGSIDFTVNCRQDNPHKDVQELRGNDMILSPLKTGYSEIRVNCSQKAVILNSTGRIVKHLEPNSVWDGRDHHNAELPQGLYIVFCGEEKVGEVTIVR
jgi:hypothetical protein